MAICATTDWSIRKWLLNSLRGVLRDRYRPGRHHRPFRRRFHVHGGDAAVSGFLQVAVSESGNHDNNVYNQNWSEKHHGIKKSIIRMGRSSGNIRLKRNSEIAKNLKGHLLLSTGDMDDNVHMANTMRMADALIKANKRFDQFILPGMRHAYGRDANYFFWVKADYFCRWLLGDFDQRIDMTEVDPPTPPRPGTGARGAEN